MGTRNLRIADKELIARRLADKAFNKRIETAKQNLKKTTTEVFRSVVGVKNEELMKKTP